MQFDASDVRDYYETNTAAFLEYGEGGSEGAIRRAVWKHAGLSSSQAFHYIDERLLEQIRIVSRTRSRPGRPRVLDLGCGTGASLAYLLSRSDVEAIGLSLSPIQVALARKRLQAFVDRVDIEQGDFCGQKLPNDIDLAFAVESFVQSSDAQSFFDRVAASVRVGGRLAMCDDFVAESTDPQAVTWLDEFRVGWRLSSLMSRKAVDGLAQSSGFRPIDDEDWTSYLALDRLRDHAIHWLVRLARPVARLGMLGGGWNGAKWGNYRGGNALRRSLKRGWIHYRFRVWERVSGVS